MDWTRITSPINKRINSFRVDKIRLTREEIDRASSAYSHNEFINHMVLRGNALESDSNPLEQGSGTHYTLKGLAAARGTKELLSRPIAETELNEIYDFLKALISNKNVSWDAVQLYFDSCSLLASKKRSKEIRR